MNEPATFASRYDLGASPDWQAFLTLLDLNEGFAFVVLLVLNEEGAAVCRDALAKRFAQSGRKLYFIKTAPPEQLEVLANSLLLEDAPAETGAVWVSRVVSHGADDYAQWREAWRRGVTALNQHRNPLRRKFNVPVIFVGAPWLQEVLRENAPDLWSVRAQVVWVEPEARTERRSLVPVRRDGGAPTAGPDPEMALAEAERYRGRPGAEAAIARLFYRAGVGFAKQYRWSEAADAFRESLAIRSRVGAEPKGLADTNYELGRALGSVQEYERADLHLRAALNLYESLADLLGGASSLLALGDIAYHRSEGAEARRRYDSALSLYRRSGSLLGEAICIESLGNIALYCSDYPEARRLYESAIPLFRQTGSVLGEANCVKSIGDIELYAGSYAEAKRRYDWALALYGRVASAVGEANCIRGLGEVALYCSDQNEAQQRFEAALPIFRRVGFVFGEATCLARLGEVAAERSEHSLARQRYESALRLFRQVGSVLCEANCIQVLGDLELQLGRDDGARRAYRRALHLFERIPALDDIGEAQRRLARITSGPERAEHIAAARAAWLSIGREDLVKQLDDEFGPQA